MRDNLECLLPSDLPIRLGSVDKYKDLVNRKNPVSMTTGVRYRLREQNVTSTILSLGQVDFSEVVNRSVKTLLEGKLIVLPTETVYGLAAVASNADAVERLCLEKERRPGHALPLAVSGLTMAKKYVHNWSSVAERLAKKFWPGPLTIVLDISPSCGEIHNLSKGSLRAVAPQGTCGFRAPQNKFLLKVIETIDAPIVLTSANISGKPAATNVQEALESLGDRVDLFVDGGSSKLGKPSTVVKIDDSRITMLRDGTLSLELLHNASLKTIVFICSANRSRSPLAEAITQTLLSRRLHIRPEELKEHGYQILSAGIDAIDNLPASTFAKQVALETYDASLESFRSKKVNSSMLQFADIVFAMENRQRNILRSLFPNFADRFEVLAPDGSDVPDPFLGSKADYFRCARQIESFLRLRLSSIL